MLPPGNMLVIIKEQRSTLFRNINLIVGIVWMILLVLIAIGNYSTFQKILYSLTALAGAACLFYYYWCLQHKTVLEVTPLGLRYSQPGKTIDCLWENIQFLGVNAKTMMIFCDGREKITNKFPFILSSSELQEKIPLYFFLDRWDTYTSCMNDPVLMEIMKYYPEIKRKIRDAFA